VAFRDDRVRESALENPERETAVAKLPKPLQDKRNVLRMRPPQHRGETEITPAMVDAANSL